MLIQTNLLKSHVQNVETRVFVCGPGYSSNGVIVRNAVRDELLSIPNVKTTYGEDIENIPSYGKQRTDLQTLEARFAHDVDFTLLVLDSPGSIAELGTFSQLPDVRGRLIVLVSERFFRAKSYISRGPLSLLADKNPNSIIYFNEAKKDDLKSRVLYTLTFYKYVHYVDGFIYLRSTMLRYNRGKMDYEKYISPLKRKYNSIITLISVIVGDRASYAELLLLSGLDPKQLNESLHDLYNANSIEKDGAGRYKSVEGYQDPLLKEFSSTAISQSSARLLAST